MRIAKAVEQERWDKGRPPLNVFQRFEKADMVEEYRSLYNFLSCDAHSNIRALISRHISFTDSDFEVTYYKDEPIEAFNSILDSSAGLLLQASLEMHNRYVTDNVGEVTAMLEELKTVREKIVA
jgi:hypothetical protein